MKLAAPIDSRLFFAGEACSQHDFSTAHGGWITGVAAADQRFRRAPKRRKTAHLVTQDGSCSNKPHPPESNFVADGSLPVAPCLPFVAGHAKVEKQFNRAPGPIAYLN